MDEWTRLTVSPCSSIPFSWPGKVLYRRSKWYTIRDNHLAALLQCSIDDKGIESLLISTSVTSPTATATLRRQHGTSLRTTTEGSESDFGPHLEAPARRGTVGDPFSVSDTPSKETTPRREKKTAKKVKPSKSHRRSFRERKCASPSPSPPSFEKELSQEVSTSSGDTALGSTGDAFGAISDIVVGCNRARGALEQVETVKDTLSVAQASWAKRMAGHGEQARFKRSSGARQETSLQNHMQDLERRLALAEEEGAGMRQHTAHMVAAVDDMFNTFRNCQVALSAAVGGLGSVLEDVATTLVNRLATEAGQEAAQVRVEESRVEDEDPASSHRGGKVVQHNEKKKMKRNRLQCVDEVGRKEKQEEVAEALEGCHSRRRKEK